MITFTQLIQSSRTKDGAIYLDNAATSWPKPPGVAEAMLRYMGELGANPGRSAHRMSIQAARVIYRLREKIAAMFGAVDPLRVIFSLNVTDALNIALHGLLKPGDHVLTSSMEHNAVMRPSTTWRSAASPTPNCPASLMATLTRILWLRPSGRRRA